MLIKPDSFTGQGGMNKCIKKYKKATEVNNWDDYDKCTSAWTLYVYASNTWV